MPQQLAEVNQYYQLLFHVVEQLIATQLYPKEEVSYYHEFMYVLCGKRWTAEQFRNYIPKISTKYFSFPVKFPMFSTFSLQSNGHLPLLFSLTYFKILVVEY